MILLEGKNIADEITKNVTEEIKSTHLIFKLAVILIGDDPASKKYVSIKKEACKKVGIEFELYEFSEITQKEQILNKIFQLNKDKKVTGIMVQLPLPDNFVPNEILEAIDPKKDVDGLTSTNLGRLMKNLPGIFPATPEGVIQILNHYQIPISGQKVAVIGQSNLVGKPLAQMLLNKKATVFIANSMTKDLKMITLDSDIVISAVGKPGLIKSDMVKTGAVVIDIGTTLVKGKIVGDVDFDAVSKIASAITPNPGGVGPMTVAMLLSNILKAYHLDDKKE